MSQFTVVVDDDEIQITVEDDTDIIIQSAPAVPNTIVEIQDVALPVHTNIDGGVASSVYGGINPIDGGVA